MPSSPLREKQCDHLHSSGMGGLFAHVDDTDLENKCTAHDLFSSSTNCGALEEKKEALNRE
jgi:hypothetical protein